MKNPHDIHSIGIIGYGGFGRFLCSSWEKMENVKILAVADPNLSPPPQGVRFYADWKDLICDEDIDIVSIATPPSSHMEIACAAMEKGKHLLIEKPLAIKPEDAERIIRRRDRTGTVATINYIMRFNPMVEALAKLSGEGVFGELRRADVENYAQDSTLQKEHWFWNSEISGGILIEHAVHFIDLVHSLTDQKFKRVTGMCFSRNERQEDQVMANVLYDRGLIATHYHSFACPEFFEVTTLRLAWDLARIDMEGWIPLSGHINALVNSETREKIMTLPGFKMKSAGKISPGVYSAGKKYEADEMISAAFEIGRPKSEVYSACVCAVLSDLIKSIENPSHKLRVRLEDGLTSLEIAALAAESAGKK